MISPLPTPRGVWHGSSTVVSSAVVTLSVVIESSVVACSSVVVSSIEASVEVLLFTPLVTKAARRDFTKTFHISPHSLYRYVHNLPMRKIQRTSILKLNLVMQQLSPMA